MDCHNLDIILWEITFDNGVVERWVAYFLNSRRRALIQLHLIWGLQDLCRVFVLFVCCLSSHLRIFSSPFIILTYTRHSWPLNSEGSLACNTYCDAGHPFIMVISEDHDTHTYCRAFGSRSVTICFFGLGMPRLGFEHPNVLLKGERSNPLRHRRGV